MAKFHFVEDYERLVADLLAKHPVDEAMSIAVGGQFKEIGRVERDILVHAGLAPGMSLIDIGCGSGRLSWALKEKGPAVDYLGTDVVETLLRYAASSAEPHHRFRLHRELTIPSADQSADLVCFFSVFTHLLHHESFLYLAEATRCLRPGGAIVFSFLEFAEPAHWNTFEATAFAQRMQTLPHLNSFIERGVIQLWASKLGFSPPIFIDSGACVPGSAPLGQSITIWKR